MFPIRMVDARSDITPSVVGGGSLAGKDPLSASSIAAAASETAHGGGATMATQVRTFGWAAWVIVFIVVLLTLLAGLLYLAE